VRKIIYVSALAALTVASCAKNSDTVHVTGSVSINGTSYPTVIIGTQTWTSVNYTGPGGRSYAGSQLYGFTEAASVSLPGGWRLPNQGDYNNLLRAAHGTTNVDGFVFNSNGTVDPYALMSASDWSGTDELGFDADPDGYGATPGLTFAGSGINATIWCSTTESGEPLVLTIEAGPGIATSVSLTRWSTNYFASVRFVKDN